MAARLNRRHSEEVREKIRASVIIDRLQKHASGELEMTQSQIKASEILLDRSVPKLQGIQISGDKDNPLVVMSIADQIKKAHE